jgi:hypothetical protein
VNNVVLAVDSFAQRLPRADSWRTVRIVDADAHHGEGIAAWVQTQPYHENFIHLEYLSVGITTWPPGAAFADETYAGAEGVFLSSCEDASSWGTDWLKRWEGLLARAVPRGPVALLVFALGVDGSVWEVNLHDNGKDRGAGYSDEQMFDLTKLVVRASAPARILSEFEGGYSLLGIALTYAAHLFALRNDIEREDLGKRLDAIYGEANVGRKKRIADELKEWEAAELEAIMATIEVESMPLLADDLQRAHASARRAEEVHRGRKADSPSRESSSLPLLSPSETRAILDAIAYGEVSDAFPSRRPRRATATSRCVA